ncbi:nuclear transport factor 2 family protein [Sphingomonas sp. RB3P16]|uniref:nuclear transport factor 2 family protein n=1 Tax=Parasphingomonas frigoris TaxID=3096163 RepID=UPI002FC78C9D
MTAVPYPAPACPAEDRIALADLVIAYASAVDDIGNVDGVGSLFSDAAVYDLSALGMGEIVGQAAIRAFFRDAFAGMAQNAHFISNIAVRAYTPPDDARVQAYGHAFSLGKDGTLLEVKARYSLTVVRTRESWRIARLGMDMLLPPITTRG